MSHLVRSAAAAVTGAAVLVGPLTSCSIFGERFEPQGAKASAARATASQAVESRLDAIVAGLTEHGRLRGDTCNQGQIPRCHALRAVVVWTVMRTNRAVALALLSGILAACGQTGSSGGGGTSGPSDTGASGGPASSFHTETTLGDVRMSTGRSIEGGDELVVEYELFNAGSGPALVHDRVPPTLGSAVLPEGLDPERAWVVMADKRIRVSKQGFDPAPGVRFIAEPVMGVRVLEPGRRLSGSARVALPAELDVPGPEFDAPRTPIVASSSEFEFCVQVTPGSQGRPSGVDPAVLEVPSAAPGADEIICSQPLGLVAE